MHSPVLFISYSSRDRDRLENLVSALRRARDEVWFDDELGGGEVWWQMILDHIRQCDVFIFAMSDDSLKSKACLAELQYAQALGKAVLPVQIGPVESMRVTPLAAVETIDFRDPTVDSGIRLITAVRGAEQRSTPLPSPLPTQPPVPYGYLIRAAAAVTGAELAPEDQQALLSEIKNALRDDDDAAAHRDIAQLLHTLRDRPDATDQTRSDVDALLKTLGETARPATSAAGGGAKKWIIGVAAILVCALAVVGAVVYNHKRSEKTATQASAATSAPATSAAPAVPNIPPQNLESILLDVAEIKTIMGATTMNAQPVDNLMDPAPDSVSISECVGTDAVGLESVYDGSGWSAIRQQYLSEPDPSHADTLLSVVEQAAVSFPSARKAGVFLEDTAGRWHKCDGQTVKETTGGNPTSYTYGALVRDGNTITQQGDLQGGEDWDCKHTMTAHANLILEAIACTNGIQDEANRIVARMVEKADA